MNLKKEIYDILYEKSRVDGIRLLNEDDWPIEQIESLARKYAKSCVPEKKETKVVDGKIVSYEEDDIYGWGDGYNQSIQEMEVNINES